MQPSFHRQRGLSLIEVAVGLLILGVLMAGALAIYRVQQHSKAAEVTARNIDSVEQALGTFVSRFKHYPKPMAFAVAEGDAEYGRIGTHAGTCNASAPPDARVCRGSGAAGAAVLIGSLPFHDLNLPADKVVDGYGRRLTYAVTEEMTQTVEDLGRAWVPGVCVRRQETNASGNVVNVDCAAPDNPPQDIAIVSHGRDGRGAWTVAGKPFVPCEAVGGAGAGAGAQSANCDNDGAFLQPVGRFQNQDGNFNDDTISVDVTADSNHWLDSTEGIYNRPQQFVGVGVESPAEALDVAGNVKADKMRTPELCERDGDNVINCFAPEKIAGNDPLMRCGPTGFVSGIDHGRVRCQALMNSFNCPAGQVLTGITAGGAPICNDPETDQCSEISEQRIDPCPVGQDGEIVMRREYDCPESGTGTGTWGNWSQQSSTCVAMGDVCQSYMVSITNSFNPTQEPWDRVAVCGPNQYAYNESVGAVACVGPPASCTGQPDIVEAIAITSISNCRPFVEGMAYRSTCPADDLGGGEGGNDCATIRCFGNGVCEEHLSCDVDQSVEPVNCFDECGRVRNNNVSWCTAHSTTLETKTSRCVNGIVEHPTTIAGQGCDGGPSPQCN